MLDFYKAIEMELYKDDIEMKLVPVFLGNDSYYSRRQLTRSCGINSISYTQGLVRLSNGVRELRSRLWVCRSTSFMR